MILQNLMDCDSRTEDPTAAASLFGILKFKTRHHSRFLNRFWARHKRQQENAPQGHSYSRLIISKRGGAIAENQNNAKTVLPKDAIQLQCLDVGSLLKMNEKRDYKRLQCDSLTEGTLSFAGSSLDLEWEHEYDAIDQRQNQKESSDLWYNSEDDISSSSSEENGPSIELTQFSSPTSKLNQQNNNCHSSNTTQWISRHNRPNIGSQRSRSSSATRFDDNSKTTKNQNLSYTSTPDSLEWDVHDDDRVLKSEEDSLDQETVDLLNEIEWLKNRALFETGDAQWNTQHDAS